MSLRILNRRQQVFKKFCSKFFPFFFLNSILSVVVLFYPVFFNKTLKNNRKTNECKYMKHIFELRMKDEIEERSSQLLRNLSSCEKKA